MRLLLTWEDLFVEQVRKMPATGFDRALNSMTGGPPRPATPSLYTTEEVNFQKDMLPQLTEASIVEQCVSPFCAKTKFVRKTSGWLRMVHPWFALNAMTIKSNYPMKRIEYILSERTTSDAGRHISQYARIHAILHRQHLRMAEGGVYRQWLALHGGVFLEVVRQKGVRQFFAPTTHPQSVGLAGRTIQLLTKAAANKST